jgi:transposase
MREVYAGLDVSDKQTHICLVDGAGAVLWRGRCASDPDVIAKTLAKHTAKLAAVLSRAVLETGPLSTFLYHGLQMRKVAVVCVCARHAKGVLSTRVNKTDPNDAEGLAQLARTGWFKAVHVKDPESHLERAQLRVRGQLVKSHRDMVNQLRGLLKLFGLRLGQVTTPNKRRERVEALLTRMPALRPALSPLMETLAALDEELAKLKKSLEVRAARDPLTRRLMTAPGVGPHLALVYRCTIEDPGRFARSGDVGAYIGFTPRRYQSGEVDLVGHIPRAGDAMLRHALYEGANAVLGPLKRPCALRTWGLALQERKAAKRARVAVARKLAVLLHRLWQDETDFRCA